MDELKLKDDRKAKPARAPLSPRLRFKVLQRDGFTCQYCGRTGEDRELEIDHIVPVSKGGTNDINNLQTACKECNRGKLAEEILTDQSGVKVIEKVVYKEVPVEKVVEKFVPITATHSDLIKRWAMDESDPELAEACQMVLDATNPVSSKVYSKDYIEFSKEIMSNNLGNALRCAKRVLNNPPEGVKKLFESVLIDMDKIKKSRRVSKSVAIEEMNKNKDIIHEWARQDENHVLKYLANEVIEVAKNDA